MKCRSRLVSGVGLSLLIASAAGAAHAQSQTVPSGTPSGAQTTDPAAAAGPSLQNTATDQASQASGSQLSEIVVTARRRSETLQNVPETVQAITGGALSQGGVRTLGQLSQSVPGVILAQSGGAQPTLSVRGEFNRIGATEPGAGVFIDGVYQNRYTQLGHGPVDAERVEVEKGPQSTLYGKNTIAGAINIVTNDPTPTPYAEVEAGGGESSVGGESIWHAQGVISGPILGDDLLGRLVVNHQSRDGYIYDPKTDIRGLGYDATSVRGKLLWHATPDLDVKFTLSFFDDNAPRAEVLQNDVASTIPLVNPKLGLQPTFGKTVWDGSFDYQPYTRSQAYAGAVQLDWKTPLGKLESVTSYQVSHVKQNVNLDATEFPIVTQNFFDKDFAFQQDLRLLGEVGKATYLLGAYYLDDDNGPFGVYQNFFQDSASVVAGLSHQYQSFTVGGTTYAAYGQVGYDLTSQFNITGGLRFAQDSRVAPLTLYSVLLNGALAPGAIIDAPRKKTFESVTGEVSGSYKITRSVMAYAKFSSGDKAGGFSTVPNLQQANIPYVPEQVDAYEIGLKSELFQRRLRLNVAAYYNDFSDLQVQVSIPNPANPGATLNVVTNAASAKVPGLDVDMSAVLTSKLRFNLAYAYINARISDFVLAPGQSVTTDLQGLPIPRSPHNSGTAGFTYTDDIGPGRLAAGIDYVYSDPFSNDFAYNPISNIRRTAPEPAYGLINLTGAYSFGKWEVSAFLRNVADKGYYVTSVLANGTSYALSTPGEPRTFEITVKRRFF